MKQKDLYSEKLNGTSAKVQEKNSPSWGLFCPKARIDSFYVHQSKNKTMEKLLQIVKFFTCCMIFFTSAEVHLCAQSSIAPTIADMKSFSTTHAIPASIMSARKTDKVRVTLRSLLREMTDREQLTRLPNPAYTSRSYSSYDRASVTPDQPGWFANGDASQFIRQETHGERIEHVMLDADGPGAIVRFWVTVAGTDGSGILRVYLDNADTPVIEGRVLELLSGGKLCAAPLSTSVAPETEYLHRGHNLYLPIPYARHCKITYESKTVVQKKESFYYNVEARTYGKEVEVETFTPDILQQNGEAIAETNRMLQGESLQKDQATIQTLEETIAPGAALTRTFTGPRAIHRLSISIGGGSDFNQALRSTIIEISFDGERTVWAPLGEFFGTGYRISPHKTWVSGVTADGVMYTNWVMPFRKTCTLTIRNLGEVPVTISKGELATAPYRWGKSSMHFGAGWYELHRYPVATKDKDQNYVTLTGHGTLVGTGVTVFNTVDSWWGEGDEKVYVDGETFPSFFGTGSEDYYGYAWCMGNRFEHPQLAQPDGTGDFHPGLAINSRYRLLDAIPFSKTLRFDMEVFHHSNSALINYAPSSFWYMRPGGIATVGKDRLALGNEKIQAMARERIVTQRSDLMALKTPFEHGHLEGELLVGSASSGSITYPRGWGSGWSGGEAIFWIDGKPGDVARFTFPIKDAGPSQVILHLCCQDRMGKVQISVNGRVLVNEIDTYAKQNAVIRVDLPEVEMQQGENALEVKLLGKNDRSQGHTFGIDFIEINR